MPCMYVHISNCLKNKVFSCGLLHHPWSQMESLTNQSACSSSLQKLLEISLHHFPCYMLDLSSYWHFVWHEYCPSNLATTFMQTIANVCKCSSWQFEDMLHEKKSQTSYWMVQKMNGRLFTTFYFCTKWLKLLKILLLRRMNILLYGSDFQTLLCCTDCFLF